MRPEANLEPRGQTPERIIVLGGLLLVVGLLITAAGLITVGNALFDRGPDAVTAGSDATPAAAAAASRGATSSASPAAAPAAQAPMPVGIRIPAIEVEASMVALGLRSDGSIEVPTDYSQTGWWADGPEPGEQGPAVVLGHVDSRSGPAVFYSLTELRPGDHVIIDRIDGSSVAYRVDRIEQHAKDRFPTEAVYGDTVQPELRLVTCGGDFDRSARSYHDNVVVFATRV